MTGFTKLEWQVFAALGASHPQLAEPLQRVLATARVTKRRNTGVGFYTDFAIDRSRPLPTFVLPPKYPNGPLDGADFDVRLRDKVLLMGFLLWFGPGLVPDQLEGFQYYMVDDGHGASGNPIDFADDDLAALTRWGH